MANTEENSSLRRSHLISKIASQTIRGSSKTLTAQEGWRIQSGFRERVELADLKGNFQLASIFTTWEVSIIQAEGKEHQW